LTLLSPIPRIATPQTAQSSKVSADCHSAKQTISVGVYGAGGTTGVELARLLVRRSDVRIDFLTSRSQCGTNLDAIDPVAPSLELQHPDDVDPGAVDFVFLCVPHGSAGALAERCLQARSRVIDVSGDHRLHCAKLHEEFYGSPRSQRFAEEAVYGLTELNRDAIREARLVANPGCFATAAILALAPLSRTGLLNDLVAIDAKSGVSGAGRTPSATNHFCSASSDIQPYKLGREHRHVAEIEQELQAADHASREHRVVFNPHLVPIERGIEATLVVRGHAEAEIRRAYETTYADESFVRLLDAPRQARIRGIAGTNHCALGTSDVAGTNAVVITVALDNLLKGAAGQAVQNMNVMAGVAEQTGLDLL
jgi:N-acetyl-gamma-glutamyl-phosphate reductase